MANTIKPDSHSSLTECVPPKEQHNYQKRGHPKSITRLPTKKLLQGEQSHTERKHWQHSRKILQKKTKKPLPKQHGIQALS